MTANLLFLLSLQQTSVPDGATAERIARSFLKSWETPVGSTIRGAKYETDGNYWHMAFAHRGKQLRVYVDGSGEVKQVASDHLQSALTGNSLGISPKFASLSAAQTEILERMGRTSLGKIPHVFSIEQKSAAYPAPTGTPTRIISILAKPKVGNYWVMNRSGSASIDSETGELLGYFGIWKYQLANGLPSKFLLKNEIIAKGRTGKGAVPLNPVTCELGIYVTKENVGRLAYYLTYPDPRVVRDAVTGEVLDRRLYKRNYMTPQRIAERKVWAVKYAKVLAAERKRIEEARKRAWSKILKSGFKPTQRIPKKEPK